jgi:crossover junction endodeoxyribonuclease RuvC
MISEKIILGIDPGTTVMGFGIISVKKGKMEMVSIHELILKKYPNHETKLKYIFERTLSLIDEFHPDEGSGSPFLWKKCTEYAETGACTRCCHGSQSLQKYPHHRIFSQKNKWITGNGNASKEQVAGMLQTFLI